MYDHFKCHDHFMANRWGNHGNSDKLYFLGLQNHCRWWLQPWNEKMLGKKAMTNSDNILKSRDITLPTEVCLVKTTIFPIVMYGCRSWTIKKLSAKALMLLNCGVGEDSWESLGLQGDPTSLSWRKSVLTIHWKDWCWSWSSNTLATWCEELTHLKRSWCWEILKAEGEGGDRGWDGWMAHQLNGHEFE